MRTAPCPPDLARCAIERTLSLFGAGSGPHGVFQNMTMKSDGMPRMGELRHCDREHV